MQNSASYEIDQCSDPSIGTLTSLKDRPIRHSPWWQRIGVHDRPHYIQIPVITGCGISRCNCINNNM